MAGHLASMTPTHTNGVSVTYTYDGLNPGPRGQVLVRGVVSRLTTVVWTYDGINRLTNETISLDPNNKNGTASYGLDPVGNRQTATSSISGLSPVSGTFNQDDELASEGYDQNGNVTATGGKTFSYDTENHLVSMNSGAVQIVYEGVPSDRSSSLGRDGDGNRVKKIVGGVTTQYLVDDLNPTGYPQVVEELTNGAVTRTYTYGLQRISQNQVISSTWTPSFYGYDGLGTVRQLTSSTGTITDTFDFDSFGNDVHSTGTTPNVYLYRGEQYDSDLGLYYLRARYYNPTIGRFISEDPIGLAGGINEYAFVGDSPLNFIDPFGMDKGPQCNGFGGFGGGEFSGAGAGGGDDWGSAPIMCKRNLGPTHPPTNPPILSPQQVHCLGQAFKREWLAFGTDVLGAIPGEGQGLAIAQLTAGGVGFVNSLVHNDAGGAVGSVLGDQTVLVGWGARQLGVDALKVVPVAGNLLSAGLAVRDIVHGVEDYNGCMGGY